MILCLFCEWMLTFYSLAGLLAWLKCQMNPGKMAVTERCRWWKDDNCCNPPLTSPRYLSLYKEHSHCVHKCVLQPLGPPILDWSAGLHWIRSQDSSLSLAWNIVNPHRGTVCRQTRMHTCTLYLWYGPTLSFQKICLCQFYLFFYGNCEKLLEY